jgi:hypothetical protein
MIVASVGLVFLRESLTQDFDIGEIRMAIAFLCGCGQRHEAPDRSAGLSFICYRCLKRVRIPVPGEETSSIPSTEPITNGVLQSETHGLAGGSH